MDLDQENFHLCASVIAQAGSKEHGDLSTGSYYPYTKVRHIISPHISFSNESNTPNFKEVKIVHSWTFDLKAENQKYLGNY